VVDELAVQEVEVAPICGLQRDKTALDLEHRDGRNLIAGNVGILNLERLAVGEPAPDATRIVEKSVEARPVDSLDRDRPTKGVCAQKDGDAGRVSRIGAGQIGEHYGRAGVARIEQGLNRPGPAAVACNVNRGGRWRAQ
jgi:hypothetical protein